MRRKAFKQKTINISWNFMYTEECKCLKSEYIKIVRMPEERWGKGNDRTTQVYQSPYISEEKQQKLSTMEKS